MLCFLEDVILRKDKALSLDFKWIENNIKFHLNLCLILLGRPQR